jgi:hypothetical protein
MQVSYAVWMGRDQRPLLIDLADRTVELRDGRIVDGAA